MASFPVVNVSSTVNVTTSVISVSTLNPSGISFLNTSGNAYFTIVASHDALFPSGITCQVIRSANQVITNISPSGTQTVSGQVLQQAISSNCTCILPSGATSRLYLSYSLGSNAVNIVVNPATLVSQISASGVGIHLATVLAGIMRMQTGSVLPSASAVFSGVDAMTSSINASLASSLRSILQSSSNLAPVIQVSTVVPPDNNTVSQIRASELQDFYALANMQVSVTYSLYGKTQALSLWNIPLYLVVSTSITQANLTTTTSTLSSNVASTFLVSSATAVPSIRYPPLYVQLPIITAFGNIMPSNTFDVSGQLYGNGTYLFKASSTLPSNPAYQAFDIDSVTDCSCPEVNPLTAQASGNSTTLDNDTTYQGGWIQVDMPVQVRIIQLGLRVSNTSTAPVDFIVLGKTQDSATWKIVHQVTGDTLLQSTTTEIRYSVSSPQLVSSVRIAVNKIAQTGNNYFGLAGIRIFADPAVSESSVQFSEYTYSTFTFTNATATGRIGPTLTNCRTAYTACGAVWAKNPDYFTVLGSGVQLWTVPATGYYQATVAGAVAGDSGFWWTSRIVGKGRTVTGIVALERGKKLGLVVGQMGINFKSNSNGGGGGGGSFVIDATTGVPLLVGGGGGSSGYNGAGGDGSISIIGGDSVNAKGGTNANGGQAPNGGQAGRPGVGGNGSFLPGVENGGGGGGSFISNIYTSTAGLGGNAGSAAAGEGGFGGGGGGGGLNGGGSAASGGGGGGFSGGAGGSPGGGGGSYVTVFASGVSMTDTNSGHGYIRFTLLGTALPSSVILSDLASTAMVRYDFGMQFFNGTFVDLGPSGINLTINTPLLQSIYNVSVPGSGHVYFVNTGSGARAQNATVWFPNINAAGVTIEVFFKTEFSGTDISLCKFGVIEVGIRASDNRVYIKHTTSNQIFTSMTHSAGVVAVGIWYHLVCVASPSPQIYLNGLCTRNIIPSAYSASGIVASAGIWTAASAIPSLMQGISVLNYNVASTVNLYIAHLRVYNRPLSLDSSGNFYQNYATWATWYGLPQPMPIVNYIRTEDSTVAFANATAVTSRAYTAHASYIDANPGVPFAGIKYTHMVATASGVGTVFYSPVPSYIGTVLYPFSTFTFSNANATGRLGPTLSQCTSAYASTAWTSNTNFFSVTGSGVQLWTVPKSGHYTITAAGARGGGGNHGKGRIVRGTVYFSVSSRIALIVGQTGADSAAASAGLGGGGGTFVLDASSNAPYICAGGGGAGSYFAGTDGNTATSGTGNPNAAGGIDGSGGQGAPIGGASGGSGFGGNGGLSTQDTCGGGGGGGGVPTNILLSTGLGGLGGFLLGSPSGGNGGFGGGGGGGGYSGGFVASAGGGGGGYSGGAGSGMAGGAGGGGSFITTLALNPMTDIGINAGMGYITVTYESSYPIGNN